MSSNMFGHQSSPGLSSANIYHTWDVSVCFQANDMSVHSSGSFQFQPSRRHPTFDLLAMEKQIPD